MYQNKVHSVENRIVSISQPWIRPIVRGKTKAPVEFGAKFDLSIDDSGLGRIEKISYDEYLKLSEDKSTLCSYFGLGGIEIYDLNKELYELNKNDILVAVTDGLYKSLNINEIKDILLKNRDVKSMAEQLIHKAALFAKGKNQDNTTVAICRIR